MNIHEEWCYAMLGDAGTTGIRLSLDELLYMCAATGAEVLLGVKDDARDHSGEALAGQWLAVKESLLQKPFASLEGQILRVTADLAETLDIICHPRLFMVATSRVDGEDRSRNYYLSGGRAVRLEEEAVHSRSFFLNQLFSAKELEADLFSFLMFPEKNWPFLDQSARLTPEDFNDYMGAFLTGNTARRTALLTGSRILPEYAGDLDLALSEKKLISTLVALKVDGAQSTGLEFLIYAAQEYLWQLDLARETAEISACGISAMKERIGHISYFFNCF